MAEQAERFAPILRDGEAFSHTTALHLLGCPIRGAKEIHVIVPRPLRGRKCEGVRGHTHSGVFSGVNGRNTLPVVAPDLAITQSAKLLELHELVVAIDHLITSRSKNRLRLETLENRLSDHPRTPGARRLRRAIALARRGAGSRMETLTRLILVAYGLAEGFELQRELSDEQGWIGRFDMVDEARKVIVEYDGEQHRTDRGQYLWDEQRLERARRAGYRVIRFHREEVLHAPETVAARVSEAVGIPATLQGGADPELLGFVGPDPNDEAPSQDQE